MNHDMTKFFSIAVFLWVGLPFCAMAAEATASGGESTTPAASADVSAPPATGTGGSAATTAGTGESAAPASTGSTVPTAAGAGEGTPAAESGKRAKIGARTSQWLDSQREGRNAGNLLPIPGDEAGLSYRRYIESFGKPIPDHLGYTSSTSTTSSTSGTSK